MKKLKHIKVGELEVPIDYWEMDEKDKKELCTTILDGMLLVLDKEILPEYNRITFLEKLIDSSIITNEKDENYEICQVLTDLKTILNELPD